MHFKAIFPLLMLSCLFLPSNCFVPDSYFVANRDPSGRTFSFTVGSSAVFAFESEYLLCGLNTDTNTTFITDDVSIFPTSYTVIGDTAYFSYQVAGPIITFNATTSQTSELPGSTIDGYRSLSSVGQNLYIAGGQANPNTLEIYDTVTKTTTNVALPFSRYGMTSVPVGNYILFAGGVLDGVPQLDVTIFDVNTRTFTPTTKVTTNSINGYIQGVSVGQYAIFISGNDIQMFADVFDSSSMTWTTHTLSQPALSYGFRYQFSIVKNDRYVFLVAGGVAEIFDSFSQTWSTLYFAPTATNAHCPSTIVNNYALFGCYSGVYIVDISTFHALFNTPGIIGANVTSIGLGRSFGATAIGDLAIFLTEDNGQMNVTTLDFSTSSPTPVSAPITVPPVAPPTVIGLSFVNPTDDATVRNGIYANNNYALEPTMYIKYSTNPDFTRQIYIKFPLTNLLPVGSSRVVVRLLGYYQSTLGPLNVQCYAVPSNASNHMNRWTQSSITWNNQPALGALLSSTNITHPISYYEWDVTSYVADQQSSGATSVSFAFVRNTPGPDESTVLINSVEADVNRPILAITNQQRLFIFSRFCCLA